LGIGFLHEIKQCLTEKCWVSFLNPTYEEFTHRSMLGFVPQPNLRGVYSQIISEEKLSFPRRRESKDLRRGTKSAINYVHLLK